jgi:cobaltochelatase CobS
MSDVLKTAESLAASLRGKKLDVGALDALKVDADFIEDEKAAWLVDFAITTGNHAMLVGPTGSGKSSLVNNVCARRARPYELVNCFGESSREDIIGKLMLDAAGKLVFVKGPAVRAYEEGKCLLLEEWDRAQADALVCLNRMLEVQSDFCSLDIGEHVVIKKHRDFCTVATSNTIGWGEGTIDYQGAKPQDQAFINRFGMAKVDYLDAKSETKVVQAKTGVDRNLAVTMVACATEIRKAKKTGVPAPINASVSTRDLLAWGRMMRAGCPTPILGAEYCFLTRAVDSDQEVMRKIVENRFR